MRKEYKEGLIDAVFGFMEGSIHICADICKAKLKELHNLDCEVTVESYDDGVMVQDEKITPMGKEWIGGFKGTITVDGETYTVKRDFKDAYEHDKLIEGYYDDNWFYERDIDYHTLQWKKLKANL